MPFRAVPPKESNLSRLFLYNSTDSRTVYDLFFPKTFAVSSRMGQLPKYCLVTRRKCTINMPTY